MGKRILICSSSPRQDGNSETLAEFFAKGAIDSGNDVEIIYLREKHYSFCKGCLACQKLRHCIINDDAVEIVSKMHDADVLVFASPIYYYSISGQLKTMLDRANPLFDSDYKFKEVYLLLAAAENEEYTPGRSIKAIQGWVDCFPRSKLIKTVFAGGVKDIKDISGHPALKKAYQIGKEI